MDTHDFAYRLQRYQPPKDDPDDKSEPAKPTLDAYIYDIGAYDADDLGGDPRVLFLVDPRKKECCQCRLACKQPFPNGWCDACEGDNAPPGHEGYCTPRFMALTFGGHTACGDDSRDITGDYVADHRGSLSGGRCAWTVPLIEEPPGSIAAPLSIELQIRSKNDARYWFVTARFLGDRTHFFGVKKMTPGDGKCLVKGQDVLNHPKGCEELPSVPEPGADDEDNELADSFLTGATGGQCLLTSCNWIV